MAVSLSDIGGIAGLAGGAVGDLFSAQGSAAAAKQYGQAATLAEENVGIEKQATAIKEFQEQRTFEKTIGAGEAAVAGNGFGASGSALDILRDSTQQGALAHASIAAQGVINEQAYQEQAIGYQAAAAQATSAAKGGLFGGILKGVGAVASIAKLAGFFGG